MIAQHQKKCSKNDRHRVMTGCHSLGATVSSAISRSSLLTCWRNSLAIPGRTYGASAERAHIANPRLQQVAFHAPTRTALGTKASSRSFIEGIAVSRKNKRLLQSLSTEGATSG